MVKDGNKGTIDLELLEEVQLMEGHCPQMALYGKDGTIILLHWENQEAADPIFSYSRDAGISWTTCRQPPPLGCEAVQLSDGSVLTMIGRSPIERQINPRQPIKTFLAHLRRAKSVNDLIEGTHTDEFVPIRIPYLCGGMTDNGNWYLGNADGGIVETPSGRLINTMSGHLIFDRVPIPYFRQPAYQFRVWCCTSEDRGQSWQYLSTVASSATCPVPPMAEGFNENDLICTGEHSLLCVMRTGGQPGGDFQSRYFPLYASRSLDGGLTWDTPSIVSRYGVWPRLLRMSNGIIVCKSGRPGTFLLFSTDGGERWSSPHVIDGYDAPWVPTIHCSCGYGTIGEVEPGVLTVLYDRYDERLGTKGAFALMMRKYRVRMVEAGE